MLRLEVTIFQSLQSENTNKGDKHVDWTNIVVAGLAFLGSVYGSYKSKDKIIALLDYRLKEIEKKNDKHKRIKKIVYNL